METQAGLPNSCSKCGKLQKVSWFAPNEDVARSGGGLCASCAGEKQTMTNAVPTLEAPGTEAAANARLLQPETEAQAQASNRPRVPADTGQAKDTLRKK